MRSSETSNVPHGTNNGYNNYGCRCDECRKAGSEYRRDRQLVPCAAGCGTMVEGRYRPGTMCVPCRAASRTIPLDELHGTETGYSRGCRCDQCRAAVAAARQKRRYADIEASRKYDREYKRRVRSS